MKDFKVGDKVKVIPGMEHHKNEYVLDPSMVYTVTGIEKPMFSRPGRPTYTLRLDYSACLYFPDRLMPAKPKPRYKDWEYA